VFGTKDTCSLTDLEKNLICLLGYVTIGQFGGKVNLDTSLHSDFGGEDNLDTWLLKLLNSLKKRS